MQFQIRALDAQHHVVDLTLEALDEGDLHSQLSQRGLSPITQRVVQSAFGRRSARFALVLFAQELHALLVAGVSVIEALEVLIDKEASGTGRSVLMRLAAHVREGLRLSNALAQQPEVFPSLFIGIVQSAESTSDLPGALSRFIAYETRLDGLKHKVISSAIYPSLLMLVGGGVAAFLLGYVVPRFSVVFRSGGRELPWASQLLLDWGQFAGDHAFALVLAMAAVASFVGRWAWRHVRGGTWWQLLAIIPGTRARLEVLELSRLYLTLGMLLEGGMPITSALKLSRSVLPAQRQHAVDVVTRHIEEGTPLSAGLAEAQLMTPVALRLLKVGERSGQLGTMLTRAAAFYEGDIARWIDRFTRTFEPVLMAAIGLVIGLIVVLLYMPIFELAGSLQQ